MPKTTNAQGASDKVLNPDTNENAEQALREVDGNDPRVRDMAAAGLLSDEAVAVAQGVAPGLKEARGQSDTPEANSDGTEPLSASEEQPYEEWTKEQLQEELEERGLPKSGNKDELVVRLLDNDDENDAL